MKKLKLNKFKVTIAVVIGVLFLLGSAYLFIKINPFNNKTLDDIGHQIDNVFKENNPKINIVDMASKERVYGVMIDNHADARPHSGLQQSFLTYEFMVEGGITRLFALFKDTNVKKIGPVRSSRHYYLDYALESDALYVHFGWSTYAQADIKKLDIDNIDGITNAGNLFWRDNDNHYAPHNAYISTDNIKKAAQKLGYKTTSDNELVLDISAREVDYSKNEKAVKADEVNITYSNIVTTTYKYDSANKVYLRSVNGKPHMDNETKKQYTVKNIIVISDVDYETVDSKGRQEITNTGTGKGKFITNGYAIDITWEKKDRASKTIYKTLDGEHLKVNDGNTYIQVQPTGKKLEIK